MVEALVCVMENVFIPVPSAVARKKSERSIEIGFSTGERTADLPNRMPRLFSADGLQILAARFH